MLPSAPLKPLDETQLSDQIDRLLKHAGRDLPFLTSLIETLTCLVEGEFGAVVVTPGKKGARLVAIHPLAPDGRVSVSQERLQLLRDCAIRCREAAEPTVFRVGTGERVWDAVCAPLRHRGRIEGVAIVLSSPVDETLSQSKFWQVRWCTSLYPGHVARRMLARQMRMATETRAALAVLSAAQQPAHFEACCMSACNQLKAELGARRVSLGWTRGSGVHLIAMSDTENIDRRQELVARIEATLEECFDQEQAIVAPSDHLRGSEQWLTEVVSRSHHELISDEVQTSICSVPLRYRDDVVGVVTVERSTSQKFDGNSCSHLQAIADLVTPRLVDRHENDRLILVKLWQSTRRQIGKLLGPQHVGLKIMVLVVFGLMIYTCLGTWPYRINASFALEAGAKHFRCASFEGFLKHVYVEPGDNVEAGDILGQLDDSELQLERMQVNSDLEAKRVARLGALKDLQNRGGEAKLLQAVIDMLEARAKLLDFQIEQATLKVNEDGVVLSGDWLERQGVRVKLGEPIFEVAPLSQLRAVILVDEVDIDRVKVGSHGELATRGKPDETFKFKVTRVIPIGEARLGRNVFAVRAELGEHAGWMRPGMAGSAKIEAGHAKIIWITTHRLIDFLRLKLWW